MWNSKKGFGFIKPDDGGADVFCHVSALQRANMGEELQAGDRVSFEAENGKRGLAVTEIAYA